ncbi:MAG: hypothetical protein CMJ64_05330 [Planctomycetaceae bacterium]|nr:hypothetical protein [Planctomycetaceae bacterium]
MELPTRKAMKLSVIRHWFVSAVAVVALAGPMAGCSRNEATFNRNEAYVKNQERLTKETFSAERKADLDEVLSGLFGTPDRPIVPALGDIDVASVMDATKLHFAAGPVGRDERGRARGLYREHCAHCHGVTGDGGGPTALFLNPYPRDYRRGTFKFKSTPRQSKPTHEDLKRILIEGIPDTAMPSFRALPDNEIDALIHYVRYLSIRGESERSLVQYALFELEPADEEANIEEERLFDLTSGNRSDRAAELREYVGAIVQKWLGAEAEATAVAPPSWLANGAELSHEREVELLKHGRDLFYGKVAACVKCHGDSAIGDGQTTDYDDWAKELEPTVPGALDEYLALGRFVFPPRNVRPRNLRMGHYRGGRKPVDIYWRIFNGIDGTPMPALSEVLKQEGEEKIGVTHDDIWALVYYVRSLPYESISQPVAVEAAYQRERQ